MNNPHTDIKTGGWVNRLPEGAKPYILLMRLDRPIGTWLLLLPSWWAIIAAANGLHGIDLTAITTLLLFSVGALIMRGAGCVINDLWDKDFDAQVERTKNRPLASGQITPQKAILFLGCLLALGLIILLQFNKLTIILGFLALIPVTLYPLAKRITWYPQAVLGLTFNFGALMGATAILGTLPAYAYLLYAAGLFWTMGYDTIYARQDIGDDALIGVKSTARKFGDNIKAYVAAFYALTIALLITTGYLAQTGIIFYAVMALAAIHTIWQVKTWNLDDHASSLQKFRSNRDFALIVTTAFLLGFI